MAAKDKNVQPRVVSPIEVSPRLVEPKSIKYPFAGGGTSPTPPGPSPIDDWWGLKLTMPEGGTVILRKNGNPNAVSLEVSTDGQNWQPWTLVGTDYTYTLQAGETLCIRNTSVSPVGFSKYGNEWYFVLLNYTYASGSIMSLMCNDETVRSILYSNQFTNIFLNCAYLLSAPDMPATYLSTNCYSFAYYRCTSLIEGPFLPAAALPAKCYDRMFYGCTSLKVVRTQMTDISANDCIFSWLNSVAATGDFYCPAELTIPTGASGIPSGWTRHDI